MTAFWIQELSTYNMASIFLRENTPLFGPLFVVRRATTDWLALSLKDNAPAGLNVVPLTEADIHDLTRLCSLVNNGATPATMQKAQKAFLHFFAQFKRDALLFAIDAADPVVA